MKKLSLFMLLLASLINIQIVFAMSVSSEEIENACYAGLKQIGLMTKDASMYSIEIIRQNLLMSFENCFEQNNYLVNNIKKADIKRLIKGGASLSFITQKINELKEDASKNVPPTLDTLPQSLHVYSTNRRVGNPKVIAHTLHRNLNKFLITITIAYFFMDIINALETGSVSNQYLEERLSDLIKMHEALYGNKDDSTLFVLTSFQNAVTLT